jgi:NADH:ubiquinone oxidoreductase subunit E
LQNYVAQKVGVSLAHIAGIVSFYNYFATEPRGKYHIAVCMGTACFVRGSADVLAEFERVTGVKAGKVAADGHYSIDVVRCIGACGLAPVLTVNGKVYGKVTTNQVKQILDECKG